MFRNIAVPLDGSDLAARALPYAERLAGREGRVHVVRARQSDGRTAMPALEQELEVVRKAELDLRAAVQHLGERGIPAEPHILTGQPARTLLYLMREHAIQLIVMSTHGRGGLDRLVFGSVAEAIVRLCGRPILLISPHCARAWDHRSGSTVLVPVDGSGHSEEAIEPAQQLAKELNATITLALVIEPPAPELYTGTLQFAGDALTLESLAQEAQGYLDTVASRLGAAAAPQTAVRFGHPASAIAQLAGECGAEAIVMATHGRTGFARMLLGSVASGVVQRADVPVLLTKPAAIREAQRLAERSGREPVRVTVGLDPDEIELVRHGLELVLAQGAIADFQSDQISRILGSLAQAERTAGTESGAAAPHLSS